MNVIEASAPGKLYIAGEYAVLEPGHPAVLVALDQFITVRLKEAQLRERGSIRSRQYGGLAIPWTRKDGKLVLDERENPFAYITQAATMTENYLKELGKTLSFFDLEVLSELDNQNGKKYGLGSSGAVTVATVKALLKFYQVDYTAELVYKLSALAHLSLKSNGSFGDLAASAYGGWLAYTCFDRDWVLEQGKTCSIGELIAMPWPNLKIQPLNPPKDLRLLIGWTGTPASTTHLVDLVKEEKEVMNGFYWDFLAESKKCVEGLISAFINEDFDAIQHAIRKNRVLLQDLSKHSGVIIETAALTQLCELAETIDGAAKSSGAGGGDCGIVLINRRAGVLPLISNWEKHGITNLPLHVFCFDKEQPKALIWEEK